MGRPALDPNPSGGVSASVASHRLVPKMEHPSPSWRATCDTMPGLSLRPAKEIWQSLSARCVPVSGVLTWRKVTGPTHAARASLHRTCWPYAKFHGAGGGTRSSNRAHNMQPQARQTLRGKGDLRQAHRQSAKNHGLQEASGICMDTFLQEFNSQKTETSSRRVVSDHSH
eukprot:8957292-Pyramimonas_sp.AAC.1